MSDSQKFMRNILLFGGMWGVAEATLGYLLHFLPTGISGMVMFPIGFYFMFNAFKSTGKESAIFMTAMVAAGLKCVDLLIPANTFLKVSNPALSIILESLVVFGFVTFYREKQYFQPAALVSLGWIFLFIISQALIFKPAEGLYLMPAMKMTVYIAFNTFISGLLIGAYLKFRDVKMLNLNISHYSFIQPGLIILLAIICELGNSLI